MLSVQGGEQESVMAGLDDDLNNMLSTDTGAGPRQCKVGYILGQLTSDQRDKLARLIDANVVPSSQLASMLRRNGYEIRDANIARHRRRLAGAAGCACP